MPLPAAICAGQHIDVQSLDGRILRVPLKEVRTQHPVALQIGSRCILGVMQKQRAIQIQHLQGLLVLLAYRRQHYPTNGTLLQYLLPRNSKDKTLGCGYCFTSAGCSLQVVTPGLERIVKNEGMPISKRPGEKGSLRIKMDVEFPKRHVTEPQEINAVQQILVPKM